jgi:hypothetical protein
MNPRTRDRLLLAALFGLVPLAFVFLVLLPVRRRMAAERARMDAIQQRLQALPAIQPLSLPERALLEDAQARWRFRVPLLKGDADRFAHYHFVISGLETQWRREGVELQGVRSSWDPIKGSYSLPEVLGNPDLGLPRDGTAAEGKVQGWVLEARVGGSPDRLIQGLAALDRVEPLLEPVGLRWESSPERTRQCLLLRNLILAP